MISCALDFPQIRAPLIPNAVHSLTSTISGSFLRLPKPGEGAVGSTWNLLVFVYSLSIAAP